MKQLLDFLCCDDQRNGTDQADRRTVRLTINKVVTDISKYYVASNVLKNRIGRTAWPGYFWVMKSAAATTSGDDL